MCNLLTEWIKASFLVTTLSILQTKRHQALQKI
jgi:hypothetical protein